MLLRKLAGIALTGPKEFAPGIPASRQIEPIPFVHPEEPQTWGIAVQRHIAEKAGEHLDLRLVDPSGKAHSWAVPSAHLPKPGEKVLIIPQPVHSAAYAAKKGMFEIPEGYGKGTVEGSGISPVEIVRSKPGHIRFNVYGGVKEGVQEYNLITIPNGTLLHNVTATAESGVRGRGGHPIPNAKPDYRELSPDKIKFDDPNELHQAKLDGSHVTVHLLGEGRHAKIFSYRPTERDTGVIEHTHKLPQFRALKTPSDLAGTVLRGELFGQDKETGKALPAETTGGLLNANTWRSREKQQALGAVLSPVIFDVVRYKGRLMENAPYLKKLQVLKEVESKVPQLKMPPMATSAEEKQKLFEDIREGRHPLTSEGVVVWKLDDHRPTKVKFRPDVDAIVTGVTKGTGKHEGRIGALQVRLPDKDAISHVGTGFSDQLREQIAKNPEAYIGRAVKVYTQQVFPSGKLRAPSFAGFHLDKGKQPFEEKTASALIHAYVIGPSGAGKTTYVKKNYPADQYHVIHSDKYAIKTGPDLVKIDWDRAMGDAKASGKPIVVDAMHPNEKLMAAAKEKILLDPGRVRTITQMIDRRAKRTKKPDGKPSPIAKLDRFNEKTRPLAEKMGFLVKEAGRLMRNPNGYSRDS